MSSLNKLLNGIPPSARYAATFTAGAASGISAWTIFYKEQQDTKQIEPPDFASAIARFEKKVKKLQRSTQERVHWTAVGQEMLGLAPRLWMEVLDQKHRYASLLQDYWRRWQLSDTRDHFFNWLDYGQGSLIDLPHSPRRLLDEWHVLYLRRDQQAIFHVTIEQSSGRFLWEVDGTPVTLAGHALPWADSPSQMTLRERAVTTLLRPMLEKARRRDQLLDEARKEVERAIQHSETPTAEKLERLAAPLIEEDLLCQLRDPFFAERLDAATSPEGHNYLRALPRLPKVLLPGRSWADFLKAIDHDEGKFMQNPFPRGDERAKGKGIFVLDSFGQLYCGTKIRGVFHHSSFVRGHCVRVAGGITIHNGWLVALSPHSGHYQPEKETVEQMIDDWKEAGVNFTNVKIEPYLKR